MPKFVVSATLVVVCSRTVDAANEEDAIEECERASPEEWREGFGITSEYVETLDATKVKKKGSIP